MYVTQDALITRFGELLLTRLTNEAPGAFDQPAPAVLERAIKAVTGVIDSHLRERYTLPLSEVPDELQGYAEDLVLDRIYSDKPERETPKDVRDRAREAMTFLANLKKGLASLSVAELPPAPGAAAGAGGGFIRCSKKPEDRIFPDSRLDRFTR